MSASHEVRQTLGDARTPRAVKDEYKLLVPRLREQGCRAATYRLSGPGEWPRYCVYRFAARSYRLVMEFPTPDEISLLVLMPHDNHSDPAAWLVERYGLPPVEDLRAWRTMRNPECCADSAAPPLPPEAAELLGW